MAETKNGSDTHSIESATTVGSAAGNKENKGLHYLKNFIGSTLRRDKNEPTRFLGDGVSFKAKLIGILEVSEARGDRMCQEALSDLKTAIRAAGEHKQRIIINIAIDGLRLRDEKTGDCLYHHPVHKISFIAQDMSDSRAFGYIFGSPDTGHRFFGIKTDKAASQVVITMRDLFQVVFELKKKEIEMAKQHIEQHQLKYSSVLFSEISNKSTDTLKMRPMLDDRLKDCSGTSERGENNQEHIMDLLDLELELNNIQLGINQMDRITPSDPFGPTAATKAAAAAAAAASSHDPFGDSFNPLSSSSSTRAKIPPPPDTGKSTSRLKMTEKHWFDHETEALFEETELPSSVSYLQSGPSTQRQASESPLPIDQTVEEANSRRTSSPQKVQFDVFTDLDPLGTGRSKPYVDKKDFFQDLKNPPKKVLKDLVTELPLDSKQSALTSSESDAYLTSESHLTSEPNSDSTKPTSAAPQLFSNAFPDDPFDKDPFTEVDFSPSIFTPTGNDPFEKFANFDSFKTSREADKIQKICKEKESKPVPLKVSLPPEKISTIDGGSTLSPLSLRKAKLQKASSLSCVIKPPSPKPKFRSKLAAQTSSEVFNDDGLKKASSLYASIPDSASAPEPPPRSAINSFNMKPPPLPPKRVTATISTKPPFKPPNSDYDYIENYQSTTYADVNSPPLPAPARKLRNTSKSSLDQDYYLQPFPLLPPPKKKNAKPSASPPVANKCSVPSDKSLDITLSQLTKTGFSDLAAMLNMSPTSLSKMTLQDLTVCLAKLSNEAQSRNNGPTSGDSVIQSGILNSQCYSALRESIDEESSNFKAEFDVHFRTDSKKEEEESLFDKYAVFRELLEEEKKQSGAIIDKVNGEPSADGESVKIVAPSEDRYAALRDICLDEVTEEKFEDLSDKEDSIIEPSRLEEDTDLLPQSRAHSESTESPTITLKEHQSIMEATIMEEDNSALDGDEDVPEEVVEEVKPSTPSQHRLSPKQRSKTLMNERSNVEKPNSDVQSSWAKFESAPIPVGENAASVHAEGHMSSWSNDSKDNELPSASRDKKKQRKIKRYKQSQWQEDEESEEGWEGRPDHNSWSPSWRENGWSDGDSLYDETPPYIERDYHSPRRGRRRRISPWNSREQSPWEEDDHELSEDQWEGSRWQDEPRQRPKHRGQSWEEDRRRYYMDFMDEHRKSRKPMSWTNDLDRKSSRESLNWEDEERYQKRNYMERRRRKWDDDGHNRNRSWREREWTDPGGKMNNRYYKERVHDPHWDGDYGEPFDDDKSRWSQRPRSCDRARRQFVNHTLESEFQDRRYMRARDTPSDVDYRRKTQAPPSQKQRRKHNQSSPFEDDFSTQFGFSKNSISGPDDATEEVSIRTQSHKKPPFTEPFHEFTQYPSHTSSHCSQDYPRESSTPNTARSYQQSPFEDDFTSNEVRRSSGRSASSELSDHKCNEDTFFPSPSNSTKTKHSTSANQVEVKTDNAASQSKDVSVNTTDSHFRNKLGSSQLSSDSDFKQEPPSRRIFKNSDSSSSLCKSESVNIFARKNDPFDDDFFCEGSADSQDDKTPK